jgi:hypothetical protein
MAGYGVWCTIQEWCQRAIRTRESGPPFPRQPTLCPPRYNHWLEDALAYKAGAVTEQVLTLMGFLMVSAVGVTGRVYTCIHVCTLPTPCRVSQGFKKDHPLHEPGANRFIHAGRNAHQEYNMFQYRSIPAYVGPGWPGRVSHVTELLTPALPQATPSPSLPLTHTPPR